jgi:hypothetical protein
MFKKKNVFEYSSIFEDQELTPSIQPMKNFIPDWYKKSARYTKIVEGEKAVKVSINELDTLPFTPGLKYCVPFLESMLIGYSLPLPFEIMVKQTEHGPIISWNNEEPDLAPVGQRNDHEANLIPTPAGYSNTHFVWLTKHILNIPKGFSVIMGHPFNRFDLPFITLTGIVDSTVLHEGQIPFFIKEGFEGLIPAGTPILQIIPFKKDNWTSRVNPKLIIEARKTAMRTKVARNWYKNTVHQKKNYD